MRSLPLSGPKRGHLASLHILENHRSRDAVNHRACRTCLLPEGTHTCIVSTARHSARCYLWWRVVLPIDGRALAKRMPRSKCFEPARAWAHDCPYAATHDLLSPLYGERHVPCVRTGFICMYNLIHAWAHQVQLGSPGQAVDLRHRLEPVL